MSKEKAKGGFLKELAICHRCLLSIGFYLGFYFP